MGSPVIVRGQNLTRWERTSRRWMARPASTGELVRGGDVKSPESDSASGVILDAIKVGMAILLEADG